MASPTRRLTSDGYLHKTVVPTYHFQSSLPKLHLPKLEATLDRYLASVTPMATPEQLWRTREAAREFAGGVGQELHAELAARNRERYSSYISVSLRCKAYVLVMPQPCAPVAALVVLSCEGWGKKHRPREGCHWYSCFRSAS